MTRVVAFGVRYLRMRLDDSPLDEFHRAINVLKADTCDRGRCDPGGQCGKHRRRSREREARS